MITEQEIKVLAEKYIKEWHKEREDKGWEYVIWLLPPEVKKELLQYKRYLMNQYDKKINL